MQRVGTPTASVRAWPRAKAQETEMSITTTIPTSYYDRLAELRAGTLDYLPIAESAIPGAVRWDVPPANQGQTIETAYGDFGRGERARGDRYMRVRNQSLGPAAITYYELQRVAR